MTLSEIEKLADNICAELLISKHSKEYQAVVKEIGMYIEPKIMIMFDKNNRPYNPNGSDDFSHPVEAVVIKKNAEIYVCQIKILGFPFATFDKQRADDWVAKDPEMNYYDTLIIQE